MTAESTMTDTLRKTVDLTDEVDNDRRIATGALLVPNQVDTQGDYFEPETIEALAHDYMARLASGEATLKFMHAVDASEKLSLVENRVLETAETIGDTEHDAGTWIVSVKAATEQAWRLFKDGLFAGFSIGGEIDDAETLAADAVDDAVHVPDDHPDEVPVRRIDAARIDEFSPVDQPAVPKAQVEVLKADLEKDAEALADPDRCREALLERGHSEADADRICSVMHTSDERAESRADTAKSDDAMSDDTDSKAAPTPEDVDDATLGQRVKSLFFGGRGDAADDPGSGEDAVAKAGRTLSNANVHEAKAIHDAAETMLEREGVTPHGGEVRSYHEDKNDPFEREKRAASGNEPAESGADTDTDDMTDLTEDDIKSIATEAAEAAVEKRFDDSETESETDTEKSETDADDTETDSESEIVAAVEDLSEKVDDVDARLDDIDERVDKVAKGGATTDQIDGESTDSEPTDETSAFKAALGGR